MAAGPGSHRQVVKLTAVLTFSTALCFGQAGTGSTASVPQTPDTGQPSSCPRLEDAAIPVNTTVQAKVDGVDSAHLKAGKDIWFKVARGIAFPGCTLDTDSVVYARIKSVSSTKNPDSAELSLSFDRADCNSHDKRPFSLRVIAVIGPPDQRHMHSSVPVAVSGGARQISEAAGTTTGLDLDLNPGGPANTVRPGIVVGVRNLELGPTQGPDCSDKLTSTKNKIQLEPGSELILAMTETRPK